MNMTHMINATHSTPSFVGKLHNLVNKMIDISDYDNRHKSDTDVYVVYTKYFNFLREHQCWKYNLPPYRYTEFTSDEILHKIAQLKKDYIFVDGKPITVWWFGKENPGKKIASDLWDAMIKLEDMINPQQNDSLEHIVVPHKYNTRFQTKLREKMYDMADEIDEAIFNQKLFDELVAVTYYYRFCTFYQFWRSDESEKMRFSNCLRRYESCMTCYKDQYGNICYETKGPFNGLHTYNYSVVEKLNELTRLIDTLRNLMKQ